MLRQVLLSSFLLIHFIVAGQTRQEKTQIMEPVNILFRAMEAGDSALLGTAFYKQVSLITVSLDQDLTFKNLSFENDLHAFKKAIASEKKEPYREPIYNVKIQNEGSFAQVWAKYSFYIGKNFHHCGNDTFQLIKTDQGWKIFHLADTRQQKGCIVPKSVRNQYERS